MKVSLWSRKKKHLYASSAIIVGHSCAALSLFFPLSVLAEVQRIMNLQFSEGESDLSLDESAAYFGPRLFQSKSYTDDTTSQLRMSLLPIYLLRNLFRPSRT